ncbi:Zn-dependent exopeptidase M28, partial [Candidatus Thorarchaeota archaeon]
MKNKIASLLVCMLVITALFSITVSAIDIRFSRSEQLLVASSYGKSMDLKNNDVVIELLQQMDEALILGYLEDLVSFGPRVTGQTSCEAAGTFLYNEFQSMGLEVRYHHWTSGSYTSRNIEATLPGVDETSDEIYIVCGHYDSVAGSPGADDDASGVVAALGAAYLMSQYSFNHTVRFVAFSGEEQGLLGSQRYVTEAVGNGDNIVGTLNADMIGFTQYANDGNLVKIFSNTQSHWLFTFTSMVN